MRAPDSADYARLAGLASRAAPLHEVGRACHAILADLMPARNMYLAILDTPDALCFPWHVDEMDPRNELALYPVDGLTGRLVTEGRRLWASEEPRILDETAFAGTRPADWLGLPLVDRAGRVIGGLVVQDYAPGSRYTAAQAAFLEIAATQLSLAVQFRAADRDAAIRRISDLVEETTDLDRLYPGIHASIGDLILAARKSFIVARVESAAGVFRPVYCVDERETCPDGSWPLDKGLSGYVCSGGGRSFVFEDGVTALPAGWEVLGERPAWWLGAPIKNGPAVVGVAMIESYSRAESISREDERSLVALCPHIAQAIGRTEILRLSRGTAP